MIRWNIFLNPVHKCPVCSHINLVSNYQAASIIITRPCVWFDNLEMEGRVEYSLHKNATIHQVTTMLSTAKNVLFLGHNHLLTTSTDEPTLSLSPEHQGTFLEVASVVVIWWIVAFLRRDCWHFQISNTETFLRI